MNRFRYIVVFIAIVFCFNSIAISATPGKGKNYNIAPTINLSVTPAKKPVDIVILTDYTGTKLTALNTQINALKAQFSAVNVDPVFHIINDVKKIGTQSDALHKFRRYGRYHAKISYYNTYDPYDGEWDTDKNRWFEETELWEETEGLAGQRDSLPKRSPKNVTFTRGSLEEMETERFYRSWYTITIRCTNDVKTSGTVWMEMMYDNWYNGYYRDKQSIIDEYAEVDSSWTMEEKISDVTFDIYSLDFGKLNSIPLRTGSDRYMLFISDAEVKDYSKSKGNYFCFGDMTVEVKNFLEVNNFSLYGVVPHDTKYMTLLPDRVVNILPLGDNALFYMLDGDIQKFGTYGLEETADIGAIKQKIVTYNKIYYLMENGTIKYFDSSTKQFATVSGLSGITKLCFNGYLFALNSSGKIFRIYTYDNSITLYNNTVPIVDIFRVYHNNIFIDANGIPYIEYSRYDNVTETYTSCLLTRLKIIEPETGATRDVPAIKDIEDFTARAPKNSLNPILVLYKTGQIHQFLRFTEERVYSGYNNRYESWISYLLEDENNRVLETGVESIESTGISIFVYKKDGTVRMLNTDWVEEKGRFKDDDDDYYWAYYLRPYLRNSTIGTPLANIQKTYKTAHDYYFLTDANNRTYMYKCNYQAPPPVIGTTLIDMGTDVKDISEVVIDRYVYIYVLHNNGTLRQISFYDWLIDNSYGLYYKDVILPFNNIKGVYVSNKDVYLLKDDGYVLRKYRSYNFSGNYDFDSPFSSSLTFDKTKTYLSLSDIFNNIAASEFYPAGQYTAAFNSIYKNYSSYSGTGNMYILLGEDIQYQSTYNDYEKDPEYSRKYIISHDPYYFDNNMGLSAYHNPLGFTTNPPVKLDKPGKYVINLKARDNPKADNRFDNYRLWSLGDQNLTVYVHRKPIALQRIAITNNGNGTFTIRAYDGGSYDPDHSVTRSDKGIVAREWRWREATSTVWTTGQMNKADCLPDKSYITQLRVKDVEGVWSDYATITIDNNNPPAALFTIDKPLIATGEYLKVKDRSYPQSFSSIVKWHWIVKKLNADGSVPSSNIQNAQFANSNTGTGSLAGYDKNVKYSYSTPGKYRIYLRVKDSNGLWSDGGTDSLTPVDLSKYYSLDFEVDKPPTASFVIEKNPIFVEETLKLKDQSTAAGTSPLAKWHWIVKKLNPDGSVPSTNIQDAQFTDSNAGTGSMAGYDVNVKTLYADKGPGTYRIYLRVMNGNGMWSDGGTDTTVNLGYCFSRDLIVQESFKISNFRVVKIRDFHLEPYYNVNGKYTDKPIYVNDMAIDPENFKIGGISIVPGFSSLTKGYRFEFEINTTNFNEASDTIVITPSFYPYYFGIPGVRGSQADLYWEDSSKNVLKAGEGGHSRWAAITLDDSNRTIINDTEAIWRGEYFIPATSWLVSSGTSAEDAKSNRIEADIIVNFTIKGYKDGVMKFDYNIQQWPGERTRIKAPYQIGDVIRYDHTKNSLEDEKTIINRP